MELTVEEVSPYLKSGEISPSGELRDRIEALLNEAPLSPRAVWQREGDRILMCGTIGSEFDAWQRRRSVISASDALIAQAIGAAAVERVMDDIESEIATTLESGESLKPRRSPGYGNMPLDISVEIIRKLDATGKIGVATSASLLLVPSKSVTAICDIAGRKA